MPEWIWIVIAFWGSAAAALLLMMIFKRGGKIGFGNNIVTVNGSVVDQQGPYSAMIAYTENQVGEIQHIMFGRYLRLIKDKGADPAHLTEYEDSRYVKMLLKYLVNGGNGSRSVQKIMETEVVTGTWRMHRKDLRGYCQREIWPQILRVTRDRFNSEYDSTVLTNDGTYRDRWASTAEVVDTYEDKSVADATCSVCENILLFAAACEGQGGCADG